MKQIEELLSAIEDRASKAFPGPWESHTLLSASENDKGFRITAHDGIDGRTWIADVSPIIMERGAASSEGKASAELIAASRTDIPALVKALRACMKYTHGAIPVRDEIAEILSGTEGDARDE